MAENPNHASRSSAPVERNFSPRDLAAAIGVSESSVKRWVDSGELSAARTAGGHRRISLTEAVRFIRSRQLAVVDTEALGLADLALVPPELANRPLTAELLIQQLEAGNTGHVRGLLVGAYLRGDTLAPLCDGPVRDTMHHVGTLWTDERRGIFVEHRATDVFIQAFSEIRGLIPIPTNGARVAVGGAFEGDPYLLPSLMAATVLADLGFRTTHLGAHTPADVLAEAATEQRAAIVWMSVSAASAPDEVQSAASVLAERLAPTGAEIVVGGRFLEGLALPDFPNVQIEGDMRGLERLARRLNGNGGH